METVFISKAWQETAQMRADFLWQMHGGERSSSNFNNDREIMGQMGEIAFHIWSGLPMLELNRDKVGDQGRDIFMGGYSIDVKTAKHRGNGLLVKENNATASIFVLGIWEVGEDCVEFDGWATRAEVKAQPPQKWVYSVSHKVTEFRDMSSLAKIITKEKAKGY